MLQILKRSWLGLALLLVGQQSVFGFALAGPFNEPYQVATIGYNLGPISANGDAFPVDVNAPKNFGQGYRWNTPTNYYAFDTSFATYFGAYGIAAIDKAFTFFNSLSNVSSYSPTLAEWSTDTRKINFSAAASGIIDIKSLTMGYMLEELGLAAPDRWTWALHDRNLPPGAQCPAYNYFIIQRNFDPVYRTYSPYVNGNLLGYVIEEFCALNPNPVAPLEADAVETSFDPTKELSALASLSGAPGRFYTGFTRDDIGGLRQLYAATNVNKEAASSDSFLVSRNPQETLLFTSDYGTFLDQALTNDATTLNLLYPNLIITSTTNFFTNVISTNYTFVLTNIIGGPAGSAQILAVPTVTTNIQTRYIHTFANVVVLHSYSNSFFTAQTVVFGVKPGSVAGSPAQLFTNTTTTVIPRTNGDFYILPANVCSNYEIVRTQLVSVVSNTTFQTVANPIGIPNANVFFYTLTTYFTNYTYAVHQFDCSTNTVSLRQGIEKLRFIRRDFDSIIGTSWESITNYYQLTDVTNGTATVHTYRRVVTQPDIVFSAADLTAGPNALLASSIAARTQPNWNTSQVPTNQYGPGTIQPRVNITFNNVGPLYANTGPGQPGSGFTAFLDANSALAQAYLGSFDGTTNQPLVYPTNTSWAALEAQIYFQIITPSPLPTASVSTNNAGNPFSVKLQATGGSTNATTSYVWALDPNTTLPSGIRVTNTPAGGFITGVPTTTGTYPFIVQVTDAGSRVIKKDFIVTVTP